MDRYAVIGNPIAHSKSPFIHARFAEQTGEDLQYEAVLAASDGFADTVHMLRDKGFRGLNVTVPFKEQAWHICNESSSRAQRANAVNTVEVRAEGTFVGHNTDGVGLLRDLQVNNGIELADKRILVLGAGGAVRGVLEPLLEASPRQLVIANRTARRARVLADEFDDLGDVSAREFAELAGHEFDLVINGTAASLSGEVPPVPHTALAAGACCYDMFYGAEPTAFMKWAKSHKAGLALDGQGMLVEQAAEAFLIWRGVRPDSKPVIAALRA